MKQWRVVAVVVGLALMGLGVWGFAATPPGWSDGPSVEWDTSQSTPVLMGTVVSIRSVDGDQMGWTAVGRGGSVTCDSMFEYSLRLGAGKQDQVLRGCRDAFKVGDRVPVRLVASYDVGGDGVGAAWAAPGQVLPWWLTAGGAVAGVGLVLAGAWSRLRPVNAWVPVPLLGLTVVSVAAYLCQGPHAEPLMSDPISPWFAVVGAVLAGAAVVFVVWGRPRGWFSVVGSWLGGRGAAWLRALVGLGVCAAVGYWLVLSMYAADQYGLSPVVWRGASALSGWNWALGWVAAVSAAWIVGRLGLRGGPVGRWMAGGVFFLVGGWFAQERAIVASYGGSAWIGPPPPEEAAAVAAADQAGQLWGLVAIVAGVGSLACLLAVIILFTRWAVRPSRVRAVEVSG